MGRGLTRVRRLAGGAVFDHLLPLEAVSFNGTPRLAKPLPFAKRRRMRRNAVAQNSRKRHCTKPLAR